MCCKNRGTVLYPSANISLLLSLHVVPAPGATMSTEVLEIAAGVGPKVVVVSPRSDVEDYLQGEDSEIISAFSGQLIFFILCLVCV